jgi:hypothetical protein
VSFAAITLCVASQRVFIFVVYFVMDSVWKVLDTLSYIILDVSVGLLGHISMPRAAFEPTIPVFERLETYAV